MYCPKCFDLSLNVAASGVLHVSVNDMQRETAQVLFNSNRETRSEIAGHIIEKFDEFLKWYAGFQNREPIRSAHVFTSSCHCQNGCVLPATAQIDVVGIFISKKELIDGICQLADKHHLEVSLSDLSSD